MTVQNYVIMILPQLPDSHITFPSLWGYKRTKPPCKMPTELEYDHLREKIFKKYFLLLHLFLVSESAALCGTTIFPPVMERVPPEPVPGIERSVGW